MLPRAGRIPGQLLRARRDSPRAQLPARCPPLRQGTPAIPDPNPERAGLALATSPCVDVGADVHPRQLFGGHRGGRAKQSSAMAHSQYTALTHGPLCAPAGGTKSTTAYAPDIWRLGQSQPAPTTLMLKSARSLASAERRTHRNKGSELANHNDAQKAVVLPKRDRAMGSSPVMSKISRRS